MPTQYLRRRSVVSAEQYNDPAAPPDGVTVNPDTGAATMQSAGRVVSVHPGDYIVSDPHGAFPVTSTAFDALYESLAQALIDANTQASLTNVAAAATDAPGGLS